MTKPDKIEYIDEQDSDSFDKKLKKTKDKLKICEKERAEYLAGWQRAKADYINLQREHEQKIADYFKFANEGLILELLPVLDSFEAAIKNGKDEGIKQLYNQLLSILKNNGLEEIKAVGEKFNPELHEVIETIKSDKGEGIVIEEIQRGYKLHNKIIRPSRVKISK
ncbi:MAG: nucleotide exchange factor GrpE [Candidatus Portnoybacteria bacterium CG10_big_fil_rev_8_21_14_0_10_38_18]|uniref:Protein GrpE n=1 Tax=Candidatus Portnoybacteria bacterium CG10_big_fil_rev_8_21_14_0_10_38_18 TaxID=1974813 RepID=A0A2M8KCV7_9BACT|nr:MAG: nucleotide exchange factor GrpE [Candidatus Portnoybacteria bacterium CG10_big_fil_rev_8_21_14_0_10_38_18]